MRRPSRTGLRRPGLRRPGVASGASARKGPLAEERGEGRAWGSTRERLRQTGYTLIEILIVVAIVAIAMSLAFGNVLRQRHRLSVEERARQMRSSIERVRTLAAEVGARTSDPNNLITSVGCSVTGGLFVEINPGALTYNLPIHVEPGPGANEVTVRCETRSLEEGLGGGAAAEVSAPAQPVSFGFTPAGRLMAPGPGAAPPGDVFIAIRSKGDSRAGWGFRVLPSGIVCESSNPGAIECDR